MAKKLIENKGYDEVLWENVLDETQGVSNKQYNISALLRNVETPIVTDNKIKLKFKSKAIKNHFMDEMEDPRSRNALKSAINNTYKTNLNLQISYPQVDEFVKIQIDKLEKEIEDLQKKSDNYDTELKRMESLRPTKNLLNDDERILLQKYSLGYDSSNRLASRLHDLATRHIADELAIKNAADQCQKAIQKKTEEIEELKKNDRH
tara:strand:- start:32 stop:649 length:618 start_codon:yes stop_codon:yes gene_type:complete